MVLTSLDSVQASAFQIDEKGKKEIWQKGGITRVLHECRTLQKTTGGSSIWQSSGHKNGMISTKRRSIIARHTRRRQRPGKAIFYFITEKDGPLKEPIYGYVDLYHGKCRKAEVVTDPKKYSPEFIIVAPYPIWKRICLKQLDSTRALITKQSKLMTGSRGTLPEMECFLPWSIIQDLNREVT